MKIFNTYLFIFACIICPFSSLKAQVQEQLLDKETVFREALDKNFGILVSRNQLAIARNNASVLNSGYLPSLTANSAASYNQDNSTIEFPGQFLQDGSPRPDFIIDNAEAQRYSTGLQMNYTLFDGLGRMYNYKALKARYSLSELQLRETIENTVIQLFSVYFRVAQSSENTSVLRNILALSQRRLQRAQYAFELGQSNKLAVLNAQVDVANDSISLLSAKQSLATSKRDLSLLIQQDESVAYEVDTKVTFIPLQQIESLLGAAKTNNVQYLLAKANTRINEYDVKVSTSGYLPSIGLTGAYGWNLNQSAASAFFPGVNNATYNLNLGANFTWNLFDGGQTTTRIKNAKIVLDNQAILTAQQAASFERDLKNAWDVYENSLAIFALQQDLVATSQNNFERTEQQYILGSITAIEFRQAQLNLLNAQTSSNTSKYNAKLAEYALLQLSGQLLNSDF
jgi:outer membrane protein